LGCKLKKKNITLNKVPGCRHRTAALALFSKEYIPEHIERALTIRLLLASLTELWLVFISFIFYVVHRFFLE
jgi:hypothetical protein